MWSVSDSPVFNRDRLEKNPWSFGIVRLSLYGIVAKYGLAFCNYVVFFSMLTGYSGVGRFRCDKPSVSYRQ